jgi:hypothetical protein
MRRKKFKDLKSYLQNFFDSKTKEFNAIGIYDWPAHWREREVFATNGEYIIHDK